MTVTLVGMGCGTKDTITAQANFAIGRAQYIVGAKRLLEHLPSSVKARRTAATKPLEILSLLKNDGSDYACVLYSGDTGFYSGARSLLPLLKQYGIAAEVLPGVSSLQYFSAKLGRPWQEWGLYSAHGTDCDAVAAVCAGRPAFFLTGGIGGPAEICTQLEKAGLGELGVTVGENLSYKNERIYSGKVSDFIAHNFAPLSVVLVETATVSTRRVPGIPDESFIRDKAPMTKQEVRAAALGKLGIGRDSVCWDIGSGTGSVGVEMALQAKAVYAVEQNADACRLILANRERFGAWNLRIAEGRAPEALSGLPAPDAVFVGGSGGELDGILKAAWTANPQARVCVSAISIETLYGAMACMKDLDCDTEAVQISVSRTKEVGSLHLLMAQNPVFLITGVRR